MGPLRDNEEKIEQIENNLDADLSDFDTQPVDDEFSLLPDELGGRFEGDYTDGFQYLQNSVPVDEFFPFGDAFETQMVDLGGETQVVELCGETQPVDLGGHAQVDELCGETQQVDLGGHTQADELHGETQPVDLDGHTQVDELCGETQPVDLGGHTQVDELCGETQPVDLGGHTQVDELCGDTQPVNLGGHTQVDEFCGETLPADLGGEIQVLDECETEVPVDSDDEGGNETEVFSDTQVISVEDSAQRGGNCSVDPGNTPSTGLNKQSERDSKAESDALSNGEHHSGSMLRGSTSIRAASIRASGLAARNMVLKSNKNSCSASDNSLEQQNAEKDGIFVTRDSLKLGNECNPSNQKDGIFDSRDSVELGNKINQSDQKHTQEYDQQIESGNENSRKIGSSTARKLFMDDNASDIGQADDGMDKADNIGLPLLFASENGLGGLSYVDSQDPGESSQAHALDIVDKIVKLNIIESVEEVVFKGSTDGKSKPVSSAKGTQSLAKKATTKIREGENGAFSWDDNLEDEGGGEFFQKKKELFFDNGSQRQRYLKPSRKSWCLNSKSGMTLEENGDKEEQLNNNRKLKDAVLSDPRLLSKSLSLNGKSCELTEACFKKNLMKELDEEINAASGDRQADDRDDKDAPDMLDVGLDTQMAADAMEALCFAVSLTDNDGNEGTKRVRKSSCDEAGSKTNLEQSLYQKGACSSSAGVVTRQSKKARTIVESHTELFVSSCKQSKNSRKKLDGERGKREPKRGKLDHKDFVKNENENLSNISKMVGQTKEDKIDGTHITASAGPKSLKKLPVRDQHDSRSPVAHRTRRSMQISHSKDGNNLNSSRENIDVIGHVSQRKRSRTKAYTFETSGDKAVKLGNTNVKPNVVDYPRGRRTRSKFPLVGQEETTECNKRSKRSKIDGTSPATTNKDVKEPLDVCGGKSIQASVDRNSSGIQEDVIQAKASKHSIVKKDKDNKKSAKGEKVYSIPEASSKDGCKPSASECTTPVSCATPVNDASPICKGDEYHKQSCRENLLRPSLRKEINSLLTTGPEPTCAMKDSRRRRDMANVRVLFSHHLDADTIKQQKKILNRLGASVASSMSDASHFVTDEFARTRNMLEAIAFSKPVVTHLWLESCGEASCFIDERNYILRDARKEREFGFSMPVSLARASQHPLLQGQRVLITPSTKPGKEILASLVKAVHGLAVERLGRSSLKDENFPDGLLVLSCEEDYEICVPFLEKGAAIYSSELLLNGIVTQRLEYERHQLFTENVKRTRSTIWLKRNNNVYTPVCKSK